MKRKFMTVLKLSSLSVPKKVEKARFIVQSMKGNAYFPSPNPPLASVTDAALVLENAYLAAQGGGKDETSIMYDKEALLELNLIAVSHYVENIANNNNDDGRTVILSAGMEVKSQTPRQKQVFTVKNSKIPGKVLLTYFAFARAAYLWQYSANIAEDGWTDAGITVKASTSISGLESEKRYFFRVAVVINNQMGPFSEVKDLLVL